MMDYGVESKHHDVINKFLIYLNSFTDNFILKNETALIICYGLERFSETVTLDAKYIHSLENIVKNFCTVSQNKGYLYRVIKDINTAKTYLLYYDKNSEPLKIEVSYLNRQISDKDICIVNGIHVYKIDTICNQKMGAYQSRDEIWDLYDIIFLCNNYFDELSDFTVKSMRNTFSYKGLDYCNFIISTQQDDLIDNKKLRENILELYDKLGVLIDDSERNMFLMS